MDCFGHTAFKSLIGFVVFRLVHNVIEPNLIVKIKIIHQHLE